MDSADKPVAITGHGNLSMAVLRRPRLLSSLPAQTHVMLAAAGNNSSFVFGTSTVGHVELEPETSTGSEAEEALDVDRV